MNSDVRIPNFETSGEGGLKTGRIAIFWRILAASSPKAERIPVQPTEMKSCHVEQDRLSAVIRWTGHPVLGADFTVETRWNAMPDGRLEGFASYSGNHSGYAVETLDFPCVQIPRSPENRFCYAEMFGGVESRQPEKGERHFRLTGLQFFAVTHPDSDCCYIDARDPEQTVKGGFIRVPDDSSAPLSVGISHSVPLNPETKNTYTLPYPVSAALCRGSWYEAAMLYRPWALQQKWFTARRKNPRMREIALWFWNRGNSVSVMDPVERVAADAGVPVALDWYWWHHNPYDTDYPDFWPPREGESVFRAAVARMNRAGIYTQVYVNGMAWDLDGEPGAAEGSADSVVVNRDGTPYAVVYNVYTNRRLGHICGESPSFQKRIAALVRNLSASGLPGVYLDMIGCCFHSCCFNPAHKHDPCGGSYGRDGFARMTDRLRQENPGVLFSTESPSEAMDLFDSMITLGTSLERCGGGSSMPIPLYQAVYHGAGITVFGSYALMDAIPPWDPLWPEKQRFRKEQDWHRLYPDQFFVELARCVVFGIQPCVCNLTMDLIRNPDFAEEYRFLLETARFYYENREFLYDGRMLAPGTFSCDSLNVGFIARGIFITEETCTFPVKSMPAILHSCWESPNGQKRLFTANFTAQERSFVFSGPDGTAHGTVPAHSYQWFSLTEAEQNA